MDSKIFYVYFYRDGECLSLCQGSEEYCKAVFKALKKVFFLLLPAGFMMQMTISGFSVLDGVSCIFSVDVSNLPS